MHLTRAALKSLTGYSQPARMCAWLTERGWVFEAPSRRGDIPKVAISYHEQRMSGRATSSPRAAPRLGWMTHAPQA